MGTYSRIAVPHIYIYIDFAKTAQLHRDLQYLIQYLNFKSVRATPVIFPLITVFLSQQLQDWIL